MRGNESDIVLKEHFVVMPETRMNATNFRNPDPRRREQYSL